MIAHKYDTKTGAWMPGEELQLKEGQEVPKGFTNKPIPQPNWKPVFINGAWVETATEEEKNPALPPPALSEVEQLRLENEALRQRDAKMQDDINFILEAIGG
ncbi:hypothetical protein [Bacillus sp. B-jedd]|uniref:hypothetical protein n=1 Tax=Bacillus sp. B-jedd TaxID=1476857 RepID=UPI0005156682|nr:hypothetical protein [Bacillus sp. B-jedd]CEG26018.1 hypothetical protein BN1002_00856 [Bacillus sp. B-jedd]